MLRRNDELIYTIETIINKGNARAKNLSKLHVYKFLYLAYLRLKEKNIDICLPYSWYLHGTMVESAAFTRYTGKPLGGYFLDDNSADTICFYSPALTVPENIQYEINQTIDELINTYETHGNINTSLLLYDVYTHAPTEFQRIYKRKLLSDTYINDKNTVLSVLDELKTNYPHENYEDTFPRFLRFEELINLAIETNADENEIKELTKIFWNYFAAVLRSRENENISESEIDEMKKLAEKKQEEYDLLTFAYDEKYTLNQSSKDINPASDTEQKLLKDISNIAYDACTSER